MHIALCFPNQIKKLDLYYTLYTTVMSIQGNSSPGFYVNDNVLLNI